ncbi:hypothetical protein [Afipia massiliensis]|uniref:hypothetical protein n=1 Tax=Afipia massiliensis TaxID=211460 RepID=UPI00062B1E24|nr:hypothetical protein [Afipia massiliensis]
MKDCLQERSRIALLAEVMGMVTGFLAIKVSQFHQDVDVVAPELPSGSSLAPKDDDRNAHALKLSVAFFHPSDAILFVEVISRNLFVQRDRADAR